MARAAGEPWDGWLLCERRSDARTRVWTNTHTQTHTHLGAHTHTHLGVEDDVEKEPGGRAAEEGPTAYTHVRERREGEEEGEGEKTRKGEGKGEREIEERRKEGGDTHPNFPRNGPHATPFVLRCSDLDSECTSTLAAAAAAATSP